jgi:hypothetical protein
METDDAAKVLDSQGRLWRDQKGPRADLARVDGDRFADIA